MNYGRLINKDFITKEAFEADMFLRNLGCKVGENLYTVCPNYGDMQLMSRSMVVEILKSGNTITGLKLDALDRVIEAKPSMNDDYDYHFKTLKSMIIEKAEKGIMTCECDEDTRDSIEDCDEIEKQALKCLKTGKANDESLADIDIFDVRQLISKTMFDIGNSQHHMYEASISYCGSLTYFMLSHSMSEITISLLDFISDYEYSDFDFKEIFKSECLYQKTLSPESSSYYGNARTCSIEPWIDLRDYDLNNKQDLQLALISLIGVKAPNLVDDYRHDQVQHWKGINFEYKGFDIHIGNWMAYEVLSNLYRYRFNSYLVGGAERLNYESQILKKNAEALIDEGIKSNNPQSTLKKYITEVRSKGQVIVDNIDDYVDMCSALSTVIKNSKPGTVAFKLDRNYVSTLRITSLGIDVIRKGMKMEIRPLPVEQK